MIHICVICTKNFISSHKRKYCSYACRDKGYIKQISKNCVCGNIFYVLPYQLKRGQGKFCSRECSDKYKARKSVEEYISKSRKKEALIKWHKSEGRTKCQIPTCDWYLTLDLHRINPGNNGGNYNKKNTNLICPNHHTLITRKIKTYEELMNLPQ